VVTYSEDFMILAFIVLTGLKGVTDERTDRHVNDG